MDYKCRECGHIFCKGEEKRMTEHIGEAWGRPITEEVSCCPVCGDEGFEEAVVCRGCFGSYLEDETLNGFCRDCIEQEKAKYKYDLVGCYKIAEKHYQKEDVGINAFLYSMFTEEEINEILLRELVGKSAIYPVDCTPFIKIDENWFEYYITEGGEKDDDR